MPSRISSQMHGKSFENMIKAANGVFTLAVADRRRSPNQMFDIDADDDTAHGYPTSIKSTKTDTIGLSDARQFWQSCDHMPYRMLVGKYHQDGKIKVFDTILEVILQPRHRKGLLGGIAVKDVENFHDRLKQFGPGRKNQKLASAFAQQQKRELEPKTGIVQLNPKIDSKSQRRLQCSITVKNLMGLLQEDDFSIHKTTFGNLVLPLRIVSGKRRFRWTP